MPAEAFDNDICWIKYIICCITSKEPIKGIFVWPSKISINKIKTIKIIKVSVILLTHFFKCINVFKSLFLDYLKKGPSRALLKKFKLTPYYFLDFQIEYRTQTATSPTIP